MGRRGVWNIFSQILGDLRSNHHEFCPNLIPFLKTAKSEKEIILIEVDQHVPLLFFEMK
jgi:hypothetical protein